MALAAGERERAGLAAAPAGEPVTSGAEPERRDRSGDAGRDGGRAAVPGPAAAGHRRRQGRAGGGRGLPGRARPGASRGATGSTALLIAAVAQRRLSQITEAAEHIEQALVLAEPDGAYRVFLDGGQAVRSAMTVLVPPTSAVRGLRGPDAGAVRRPAAPAGRWPGGGPAELPLTGSELAVLRFLPSHMTNQEIAEALFLSINTVKTHLRSAYRKLGVANRRQAIARGRRLDLL